MSAPNESGLLDVDGQSIYWEEWGNPHGIPALYLHGGPGGGLGTRGYVKKFNLEHYRVIGMDQRGCGQSHPLVGSPEHDLSANTTQQLLADIEALRGHLGIDSWALNGVSWGSTLALAYAQAHPDRVHSIVLMAVTTTSPDEVHWITEGCQIFYPEAWDELATFVEARHPTYQRGQTPIIAALARLLTEGDEQLRQEAAVAWGHWEDWHVAIGNGYAPSSQWHDFDFSIPFATLVTHYWSNYAFLNPPIMQGMAKIAHIPAHLIHGRNDVSGPAQTAWKLHQHWPASTLTIVEGEGHGGPEMVAAWAKANDDIASSLLA